MTSWTTLIKRSKASLREPVRATKKHLRKVPVMLKPVVRASLKVYFVRTRDCRVQFLEFKPQSEALKFRKKIISYEVVTRKSNF